MALCIYEQKADSIRRLVKNEMYHKFLFEHMESPEIDEDRILMLLMTMDGSGIPVEKYERQIAAASLVQIALDIHDKVAGQQITLTERQLSVLAGDYFSGLYYHLLAGIDDINLIRTLANAIKVINESKIYVYQLDVSDIESFMEHVKRIECTVIDEFCQYFQSTEYIGLFIEFLYFKRLLSEMEKFNNGRFSILFEGLKNFCLPQMKSIPLSNLSQHDQHQLNEICTHHIDQSRKALMDETSRIIGLPGIFLERITELANKYKQIAT
ncbi:heptaprenyl diphosphate synthase [Siminovitchia acidinfaciens]|uniref:Heptaprenyl diphosphate synthase n=1 Tax=Siminovitchia acidinfaciens TaxID=2321395 RepID=A0A429XY41_9BACI|nr:heptaprenyl diphosphate synthase component 1 [Siminovitchia acidinfaciens]RST73662.1 heptaprenyl diphosphate synthase [Siminovitchia acidinfaciens]